MGSGRKKLITVARLYFTDRPKFGRTCRECATTVFDEETGKPEEDRTKPPGPDGFRPPMRRSPRTDPPCHKCPKTLGLKVRHWANIRAGGDPPPWCYRTFRHWLRCKAVAWQVPEAADPIVRRNAELFQSVADDTARGQNEGLLSALGLLKRMG